MELSQDYPRMLYKVGGSLQTDEGSFAPLIVAGAEDHQAALADGWRNTIHEALQLKADADAAAKAAFDADLLKVASDEAAPPTRAELEQMAAKLGINFDGRTSDRKLRMQVEAAAQPDSLA